MRTLNGPGMREHHDRTHSPTRKDALGESSLEWYFQDKRTWFRVSGWHCRYAFTSSNEPEVIADKWALVADMKKMK